MGFILWILTMILAVILVPAGMLYGFFAVWYKKHFFASFKKIGAKFRSMAEAFDRFGNVVCGELFNATLQKNGYAFGGDKETISSALGRNQQQKTLTGTGKFVVWVLCRFQKDHCIKSIGS